MNDTYVATQSTLLCHVSMIHPHTQDQSWSRGCLWYNFSWHLYCSWCHHPFMTSILPYFIWYHMTQFSFIWFNFPLSMILLNFSQMGIFFQLQYGPAFGSSAFFNSNFQVSEKADFFIKKTKSYWDVPLVKKIQPLCCRAFSLSPKTGPSEI